MNMCMRNIPVNARQHTNILFQILCSTSASLLEEIQMAGYL